MFEQDIIKSIDYRIDDSCEEVEMESIPINMKYIPIVIGEGFGM